VISEMKVRFWLLDIGYTLISNNVPRLELWGIDESGRRVLILDEMFRPYFYVKLSEDANPEDVFLKLKNLSKLGSPILKVDVVKRKYFGREITVLRVVCRNPRSVPEYREDVLKIAGVEDFLEADIRYSMRYLIDHQLTPCGWHEVEAIERENSGNIKVDKVYEALRPPKPVEDTKIPDLKVMAFDIECYNPRGAPNPEKDPVIIISVVTNTGDKRQFLADDHNDKDMLKEFISYVQEFDPDIIVGYNSNRFDWPYLMERCKTLGIKLSVGRNFSEPHTSTYGHISVTGRANIDLLDYAEELYEVKVKTLENVAEYLGVMKKSERVIINKLEISKYWDDREKRKTLLEYAMADAVSTLGIAEEILSFVMQLSSIVGLPPDQVLSASVGFRVEWHLMRHAYLDGELAPNRVERKHVPYRGGLVLKPKMGIHENVIVYDFSALYPNIMINYNVSPDTYVPPEEVKEGEEYFVAPEVGHRFRKHPPGLYKKALKKLLEARKAIREEMKSLDPESPEYRILNSRQLAIKVIANATYGYAGWVGARWYIKPVAEATTAWGREIIRRTIKIAKDLGLEVIYGDTDSVFIKMDSKKAELFEQKVEQLFGLDIKPEKLYKRIFFTEAKKRYAGLLEDGRIDVVGLEVVRGDWSEIAREVQEKVLEIILKENSPVRAAEYVRDVISKLERREIPYEKLIIWKTLGKKLDEYKVEAAHVVAAKKLLETTGFLEVGGKIGFVVVKGGEKLAEKVMPYNMATYDDIDINYYVEKQIIPAALRILKAFGYDEKSLKTKKRQVSLFEFMKK